LGHLHYFINQFFISASVVPLVVACKLIALQLIQLKAPPSIQSCGLRLHSLVQIGLDDCWAFGGPIKALQKLLHMILDLCFLSGAALARANPEANRANV
jgi:hypothetical protein